jgi:hypothetical protein
VLLRWGKCVRGGTKCTACINLKRATFMARLLPLKDVKRGLFDTGGVTWTAFVVVTPRSGGRRDAFTHSGRPVLRDTGFEKTMPTGAARQSKHR